MFILELSGSRAFEWSTRLVSSTSGSRDTKLRFEFPRVAWIKPWFQNSLLRSLWETSLVSFDSSQQGLLLSVTEFNLSRTLLRWWPENEVLHCNFELPYPLRDWLPAKSKKWPRLSSTRSFRKTWEIIGSVFPGSVPLIPHVHWKDAVLDCHGKSSGFILSF